MYAHYEKESKAKRVYAIMNLLDTVIAVKAKVTVFDEDENIKRVISTHFAVVNVC